MQINKLAHLQEIELALRELQILSETTKAPAPEEIQLLGTIIDNTFGFLTAAGNSLQLKLNPHLLNKNFCIPVFEDDKNWVSLQQAVHRSFFSSIHLGTEKALDCICEEYSLEISVSQQKKAQDIILNLNLEASSKAAKSILSLAGKLPSFTDYLNAALNHSTMQKEQKTRWRKYFIALSLVRNKVSHSDPSLNESNRDVLLEGGFGAMIDASGMLQMNPRLYRQVCEHLIQFFTELGLHVKSKS